jgi:hypothetical protein
MASEILQISTHLSDERKGEADDGSTVSKKFRLAITQAGGMEMRHPNYLTHAKPQTAPMGTPRAQSSFDLEERLSFNPRQRQQAWAPPSAAQSSGVPAQKKDYSLVTDQVTPTFACRCKEIAITSILVLTFIVLFY